MRIHLCDTLCRNRESEPRRNRESEPRKLLEPRKRTAKAFREASGVARSLPKPSFPPTNSDHRNLQRRQPSSYNYISTLPCHHIDYYGTNYQVACSSPGKSDDAIDKLLNGWLQWAGAPVEIHTESRTEFTSKEFVTFLIIQFVTSIVTPPGAQRQIGKVERHGGILQESTGTSNTIVCQSSDCLIIHCTSAGPQECTEPETGILLHAPWAMEMQCTW